jgi:hypothetical protein
MLTDSSGGYRAEDSLAAVLSTGMDRWEAVSVVCDELGDQPIPKEVLLPLWNIFIRELPDMGRVTAALDAIHRAAPSMVNDLISDA